ncbi:hypothetical protein [Streptomyces thermocarboxydovorans]|uniref:hypothetical protein n=1 Tax=Streptomyces thermocarboxydovorans TaxID=59298 RepID=UPI0031DC66E7
MTRWDVSEKSDSESSSTPHHEAEGGAASRSGASVRCPLTERERQWLRLLGEDCPPASP